MNFFSCIFLLSIVAYGNAVLSHQDMVDHTKFTNAFKCDTTVGNDRYEYQILNGFSTPIEAEVQLHCQGSLSSSQTFNVTAYNPSDIRTISPPDTGVQNRICALSLYATDPLNNTRTKFDEIRSTCGGVQLDDSADCNWFNFPCHIENGTWPSNGMTWIMIYLFAFLFLMSFGLIIFIIWWREVFAGHSAAAVYGAQNASEMYRDVELRKTKTLTQLAKENGGSKLTDKPESIFEKGAASIGKKVKELATPSDSVFIEIGDQRPKVSKSKQLYVISHDNTPVHTLKNR